MALILASGSPRRRELMALITPDYTVITSDVDEGKIAADTPGSPGAEPGFGQGPRCGQTAPGGYRPRL